MSSKTERDYIADAHQCLASARFLLDRGFPDGAGDRAFFAAFNAMRAVLAGCLGFAVQKVKTHTGLEYLFQVHVVKRGLIDSAFTKTIAEVRQIRSIADFGMASIGPEKVEGVLPNVIAFVDACERLTREGAALEVAR